MMYDRQVLIANISLSQFRGILFARGQIMAICKLCKKDKNLCNSHIIPDFFFRLLKKSLDPTKFDYKSFFVLSTEKIPSKKQTGYFEKMLCEKCENQLSEYERYV